jgi:hypothetical protein
LRTCLTRNARGCASSSRAARAARPEKDADRGRTARPEKDADRDKAERPEKDADRDRTGGPARDNVARKAEPNAANRRGIHK